jgi:hypothetical protein
LRLDLALANWTLDNNIAHRFSAAQAQDTATLNLAECYHNQPRIQGSWGESLLQLWFRTLVFFFKPFDACFQGIDRLEDSNAHTLEISAMNGCFDRMFGIFNRHCNLHSQSLVANTENPILKGHEDWVIVGLWVSQNWFGGTSDTTMFLQPDGSG